MDGKEDNKSQTNISQKRLKYGTHGSTEQNRVTRSRSRRTWSPWSQDGVSNRCRRPVDDMVAVVSDDSS